MVIPFVAAPDSAAPGSLRNVTFTWTETEPDRPARDVLVRLIALTDHAHDDGEIDAYLLDPGHGGEWSGSLLLSSDLRTSYQLCPVRDEPLRGRPLDDERWLEILALGIADVSNPETLAASCTYGNAGVASILELPDALAQPWHARRQHVPSGEVTRHELALEGAESSVLFVYTPPDPASGGGPYPLAVLFDGGSWLTLDVAATFDNLVADGLVAPMVAVLIESIHGAARFGPDRVRNLTDPEIFMPFLLEELIPFVDANWNVSADPAKTILVGQSLGGLAAAHAALTAPYRFGCVVGQSSSFWWPGGPSGRLTGEDVLSAYSTGAPGTDSILPGSRSYRARPARTEPSHAQRARRCRV